MIEALHLGGDLEVLRPYVTHEPASYTNSYTFAF
jgi:hypothetical protein